jgi:hypothetical protein
MAPPFVTTRNRPLSLWQSVVHEVADRAPDMSPAMRTKMKEGVDGHVWRINQGQSIPRPGRASDGEPSLEDQVYLSAAYFDRAEATRRGTTGSARSSESSGDY